MKNVQRQGFLPTSYYDEFTSDEESSSEESESDSEDESPYTKFQQYGGANQSSRNNRFSCIISKRIKDEFVVEDPFIEVKDEDIESVETDFNDDGTRIIHLKNGLMLWGKFKRKRRYGLGSLSGAPLEARGKRCSLSFNKTLTILNKLLSAPI